MKKLTMTLALCSLLILLALPQSTVLAHQPYCEQADLTPDTPWQVPDSKISYAYFGSLYPETDVDYFTFDASAGQSVLLSISIPAIEGFEDYGPLMVVMGPGIEGTPPKELPTGITVAEGSGAMMVPLGDEPLYWFEPFGRRYYYNWDDYDFEAPEEATYTVALWHPDGEIGRYSFVVGSEEIRGGDPECMATMEKYWTPLKADESPYPEVTLAADMHTHNDGSIHDHSQLLEVDSDAPPFVDLQVFPLEDGTYNVRIQTLNFTFAPQNVGLDHMSGSGYANLTVDGEEVGRVYGEWVHLSTLPEDAEVISVGLFANNHQPLGIDGEAIQAQVMVSKIMLAKKVAVAE